MKPNHLAASADAYPRCAYACFAVQGRWGALEAYQEAFPCARHAFVRSTVRHAYCTPLYSKLETFGLTLPRPSLSRLDRLPDAQGSGRSRFGKQKSDWKYGERSNLAVAIRKLSKDVGRKVRDLNGQLFDA